MDLLLTTYYMEVASRRDKLYPGFTPGDPLSSFLPWGDTNFLIPREVAHGGVSSSSAINLRSSLYSRQGVTTGPKERSDEETWK
jgi:hypothetical protein